MYTVLFAIEIVVVFKDVHGAGFYGDMDHRGNYTKKKNNKTYDIEIRMLITGTLGLCRGTHKIMHIICFVLL